eukprot:TRINITY_DN10384_c0_g1_i2.p1 TRINITY_DN10384_c0_g1~~TRINITY_DN10384_c0_g1_i2.p1  ORF type:complete len:185 (+),score=47.78 TRINITY_DN10384_c0_g1_i2:70-555(+)
MATQNVAAPTAVSEASAAIIKPIYMDDEAPKFLSNSVLASFHEPLKNLCNTAEELSNCQEQWIERFENENQRLRSIENQLKQIRETFIKLPIYTEKLQNMKKDMQLLNTQVEKLSKRAVRLHNAKLKKEEKEVLEKQRKTQKEKQLHATVAPELLKNETKQ